MAKQLRELMHKNPIKLQSSASVSEAANKMRDADVGSVIVEESSKPLGIVTDRDIAVRVVAAGLDPAKTRVGDVCSKELATLSPDDDLDRAVELMREKSIRRVLVVDSRNAALGVVSLGTSPSNATLAPCSHKSAPPRRTSDTSLVTSAKRAQGEPECWSLPCVPRMPRLTGFRELEAVWLQPKSAPGSSLRRSITGI